MNMIVKQMQPKASKVIAVAQSIEAILQPSCKKQTMFIF